MRDITRDCRQIAVTSLSFVILLFACTGIALAGTGDGTVLGVTKIVDNGPDAERYNLVVIAEGFTAAQQTDFNNRANQLVASLFGYPPIDTMTAAFNITRINVASNQSGADKPALCYGTATFVNTYFNATYCGSGIQRALVVSNSIVFSVLSTWVPSWDQVVVVVNDPEWGGTGGSVAVTSVASGWEGIVIHEFGHSAFGFADEYEYWAGCGAETDHNNHPASEPSTPNVTIQTNRNLVKWKDLIEPSTPVPTTVNANCAVCDPQGNPFPTQTVGLYEGADYYHCDCYRPQFSCMMRNLAPYFCAVCRSIVETDLAVYLPAPNQAPVAQCRDVTVPSNGSCEAAVSVQDIDGGSFDPEGAGLQRSLVPAGPYSVGVTAVELLVSDGQSADTCTAIVTVQDMTPPVVSCPADISVTLGQGRADSAITFVTTVSDECAASIVSSPASGSVFSEGTTPVACIGSDASGNADTCYFNVTVNLTCYCPYPCDFDADNFLTALDLGGEIDVLFAGLTDPADPGCPVSRGDFDNDTFLTILDLGKLIDFLFVGGEGPCDPCNPVQGTCLN